MNEVFADTSGWASFFREQERHHARAVALITQSTIKKFLHFFVTFCILTVLNKIGRTHIPKASPVDERDSRVHTTRQNFFRN